MNDVLREQIQLNTKEVVVNVDNDHMKASIVLNGIGSDEAYTYEEIADKLSQAGVRTGINEARIREVILNKLYDIEIVVAEGKSAVNGTDGYYNFFFDSEYERDNKPTLREDGSVDYFNVKLFEKVNKDDKLAEYIEPTKGEFGYDVFGKLLVPKPGRPGPKLRGKGFTVSEDGKSYYAQLSGKVEYRNYDLNVSNVYNVSGDVDVGTGSIDFNGDVEINGSVRGSVKIHAMGNISARFFENAHIISHSDIKCDYMLNTTALAYGGIYLEGKRGSVIGGDVTGVRGICIKACGSESYSKTVLRVGVTKEISSEYAKVLMVLKDIDTQIDRFNQALQKLDILKKTGSDKFDETLNRKLLQSKIVKTAEKAKYEEKSRNLYTLVRESDRAVVRIDKNIYPGSRVFMGDKTYVPSTVFTHIALKKTSQGVLIRNYDSM